MDTVQYLSSGLSHTDDGAMVEAASRLFAVGTTTVKNWKRLRAQTGKLEDSGLPCTSYKTDTDALRLYIKKHPDAFLNNRAFHFGVATSATHTAMKRINITRKKKISFYKECCATKCYKYIAVIKQLIVERLVYVDESGIGDISRDYAWSRRGQSVIGEAAGERFVRERRDPRIKILLPPSATKER